jgi:hypothetical protein
MAVIIVLLTEIMVEVEPIVHMERGASDDKHAYVVPESIRVLRIFLVVLDFRRKSIVHERTNLMEGYARPPFFWEGISSIKASYAPVRESSMIN